MTDKPFSKIQPRAGFTPCAGFFLSAQRCPASVSEKQNVLLTKNPS